LYINQETADLLYKG